MTNPAATPRFRMQQACYICDVSERRLRSWLDRKQITLDADAEREEGATAHRRFSVFDLVRIATVSRLVDYGAPIAEADRLAREMLAAPLQFLRGYRSTPADAVFASLYGYVAVVWCLPDDDNSEPEGRWRWERYSDARADGEVAVVRINFETLGQAVKNGIAIYAREGAE